jgi:hypothetical protein
MNSPRRIETSKTAAAAAAAPFRHDVSRSKELLSCAKTAWKLQQQQLQLSPEGESIPKPNLQLALSYPPPLSLTILEEGLTLLRAMDFGLKELQKLVRRRGHTNDPTAQISKLVKQLEQDTEELTDFCKQLLENYSNRRKQEKKHWELVVNWFQQVANHYSNQLQNCLKVRGEVLTEQAQQRRKLVDASTKKNMATNRAIASPLLFDSPLFKASPTSTSTPALSATKKYSQNNKTNQTSSLSSSSFVPPPTTTTATNKPYRSTAAAQTPSAPGYHGNRIPTGYGGMNHNGVGASYGGTGASGYGGAMYGNRSMYNNNASNGVSNTGMRQRKGGFSAPLSTSSSQVDYQQEEEEKIHYQIQERQQRRQTQQRLDEARQAESMLGELGQLFGKMSSLIVQQGETLEKIEDDVEAAHADVIAGQEELTKLYHIKKGNRPLIIKTFGILIFLVVFMRQYKN